MIFEKLQKARIELQNKKLKKSGKNKYAGFTYYELNDILPQINQIFYDLKLFSNFSILEGNASLIITDWEDNTSQEFTSPIEELELKGCTKIQALGGVHTYMKRYLYLNALEIVESDMLDANAGNIEEPPINETKIYVNLAKLEDVAELKQYYSKYKEQVKDRKKLYTLVQERLAQIKKVEEMFKEGDNNNAET